MLTCIYEAFNSGLGHKNIKTTQIYAKITNKKIEEDMAKFFNDKTISSLSEESVNMTAKDKNTTKTKNKMKGGTQASAQA